MKFLNILYLIIILPFFLIIVWFFAIPDDLLKEKIEDSISNMENSAISVSIEGFSKGPIFSFNADRIKMKKDNISIMSITDISGRVNPFYLLNRELSFTIKGKLGGGNIYGSFRLPEEGNLTVENADIGSITYLQKFGIEGNGHISSDLTLDGNTLNITFKIPDLHIKGYDKTTLPFISSLEKVQGALSLNKDQVKFRSVGLEGRKGYARLKGEIRRGNMDLTLEIMPSSDEVEPLELILIKKYLVSPGYYVIPLRGPLL